MIERANRQTVEALREKAGDLRQEIIEKYSGGLNLETDEALWDAMVFTFADFFSTLPPGSTLADFRRKLMFEFTMPMEDAISGKNKELGYKLIFRASEAIGEAYKKLEEGTLSQKEYSDVQYQAYALGVLGKSVQGGLKEEE